MKATGHSSYVLNFELLGRGRKKVMVDQSLGYAGVREGTLHGVHDLVRVGYGGTKGELWR